eukprot:CAMPEP_0172831800 /NCGR_PEP_ID=MMETSP1075-20121228/23221_1 /TAXON_ID=2916 /ORGANISM="Ceratium fusus, Strain PA161109" /LENGTH=132 /DNA_ID=CAMNT_0013674317 /DNA_START=362 /DNA_END=760 /DNA_ORIENTATION=+
MKTTQLLEATAPMDGVHVSAATKACADVEGTSTSPQLQLVPQSPFSVLMTSKGEMVPRAAIDGLQTFLLDATEAVQAAHTAKQELHQPDDGSTKCDLLSPDALEEIKHRKPSQHTAQNRSGPLDSAMQDSQA